MFDKERFIEECRSAVAEGRDAQKAVRELVAEAVADPAGILRELGEPEHAGVTPLYSGPELTVIHFVWAPYMTLLPHNHNMFAVIGIYGGREDNMFWRQLPEPAPGGAQIEAAGAESLGPGQVATLGRDIIHSVANPLGKMTATIHVYGGDFFNPPQARSQWQHESLVEEPWDMENTRATFRAAETRYRAGLETGA